MSTVLVINSGSSSIKYQLVNPTSGDCLAKGLVEQIGEPEGHLVHHYGDQLINKNDPIPDHETGMRLVLDLFETVGPSLKDAGIIAVGHRIVQGGSYFDGPVVIDDRVHRLIDELSSLAPLHNPANLQGVDVARELLPHVPHVAVFDTAFFQSLPEDSSTYALDVEVAEKYQIRRYGAHGTSHQYISRKVSELLGESDLRQVILHLGNGASASAVVGTTAIDTSMGLTPLEGLVMGTRTGDIDPAVVFHLQRQAQMSTDEVDNLFNKQSGLKGLTGVNDMRAVRRMTASADNNEKKRARLALDIYIKRIVKYIGSYTAELGGLDVLVFTAGIGENDAALRSEICQRLEPFGIMLDAKANEMHTGEPLTISRDVSSVRVMAIPTNEELEIARQAAELIG